MNLVTVTSGGMASCFCVCLNLNWLCTPSLDDYPEADLEVIEEANKVSYTFTISEFQVVQVIVILCVRGI